MKLKRIFAGALAATTLLSVGLMAGCSDDGDDKKSNENAKQQAFINELGGVSETYKGSASKVEYQNSEAAAEAYVMTEVVGDKAVTNVQVTPTNKTVDKATLNLPAEETADIVSVEEVEVSYEEVNTGSAIGMVADTLNKTKKVKVYIIKYPNYYKYYTPCPVTGETITKSYYDSVFNAEGYKNCTWTTTSKVDELMTVSASYGGESMSYTIDMHVNSTETVKFTENAVYLEMSYTYSYSATGMGYSAESENENEKIAAYIEQVEVDGRKQLNCYVKIGDTTEWIEGDLYTIGFSSLAELNPFRDQYLDYSYFTKTNYGFEMSKENAAKYVSETMGMLEGMELGMTGTTIDMFAKYYVSEGILTGMRMDMDMNINMNMSEMGATATVKGNASGFAETKVTNRGTTVVTKPFTDTTSSSAI